MSLEPSNPDKFKNRSLSCRFGSHTHWKFLEPIQLCNHLDCNHSGEVLIYIKECIDCSYKWQEGCSSDYRAYQYRLEQKRTIMRLFPTEKNFLDK